MFVYRPTNLPPNPALVVALHGCTQTAEAFNHGCGWSDLADRAGFVVIFPQQQPSNNAKNCFSWFEPSDTTREQGETLSSPSVTLTASAKISTPRNMRSRAS
jgi:feruloyl esterase